MAFRRRRRLRKKKEKKEMKKEKKGHLRENFGLRKMYLLLFGLL